MSTTTTPKTALTTEQLAANRSAIHRYIATKLSDWANRKGLSGEERVEAIYGKVILLPEFVENPTTKEWEPMPDNIIRNAKNPNDPTASMMRYATVVKEAGKPAFRYSNEFMSASQLEVMMMLENLTAGSVTSGKLIVEESLKPFSKTNPDRDVKQTPDGIKLTYSGITVTDDGEVITHSNAPIYRRTVFTNDMNRTDTYIRHTNTEETSNAARARWNTANTNSIKAQAAAAMNAK